MIISFAYKNILANKRRSIVTVFLVMFSTLILVFISGFMNGQHKEMLKSAVEVYPGYIQVTQKSFRENPSLDNLIFDVKSLSGCVSTFTGVQESTSRFETFVLMSANEKTLGIQLTGIEPEKEVKISRLKKALTKGEYLNHKDKNALYIGDEMAKRFSLKVGDEVSFISTAVDYSFVAEKAVIKGIFHTGLYEFDASKAFMNKASFDDLFLSHNMATHLIILPQELSKAHELAMRLNMMVKKEYSVESWQGFMRTMVRFMELDSIFGYLTIGVFLVVILFVILIYSLLSIFARTKEIGLLRALGTTKSQILGSLLYESVVLALMGVVFGALIGALLNYYFYLHPIELPSSYDEQFKQYGLMKTAIPAEFDLFQIIRDAFIIFCLSVTSTLYPIFKINGYTPTEAMRHV